MTDERRALWIYPWDILDAGIESTVARARHELGLHALSLAASRDGRLMVSGSMDTSLLVWDLQ